MEGFWINRTSHISPPWAVWSKPLWRQVPCVLWQNIWRRARVRRNTSQPCETAWIGSWERKPVLLRLLKSWQVRKPGDNIQIHTVSIGKLWSPQDWSIHWDSLGYSVYSHLLTSGIIPMWVAICEASKDPEFGPSLVRIWVETRKPSNIPGWWSVLSTRSNMVNMYKHV